MADGTRPQVLNLGAGSRETPIPPCYEGFGHALNDIDPACRPDILLDGRDLATLDPAQADAVCCSHNLAHYRAHEVPRVLAGMLHVLKPDGFADIRVPALGQIFRDLVARGLDIGDLLYTSPAGPAQVRDVIRGLAARIESTEQDHFARRTGFTQTSLAREPVLAGFGYVVRRPGRASEISVMAFRQVPTEAQKALVNLRTPLNLLLR